MKIKKKVEQVTRTYEFDNGPYDSCERSTFSITFVDGKFHSVTHESRKGFKSLRPYWDMMGMIAEEIKSLETPIEREAR